jgi:signal peptidase I
MRTTAPSPRASLKLLLILLYCSALSVLFLHRYVFALYVIEGPSMWPTLKDGDTALVNMLARRMGPIQRGEIILVRDGPYRDYATKRVVGLPGEKIDFRNNKVYVNGRELPELYLPKGTVTTSGSPTFLLGPRQYFVLGDNRPDSFDSRCYGPIPENAVMGSYSRSFWAYR